jgi:hypothetical protein
VAWVPRGGSEEVVGDVEGSGGGSVAGGAEGGGGDEVDVVSPLDGAEGVAPLGGVDDGSGAGVELSGAGVVTALGGTVDSSSVLVAGRSVVSVVTCATGVWESVCLTAAATTVTRAAPARAGVISAEASLVALAG